MNVRSSLRKLGASSLLGFVFGLASLLLLFACGGGGGGGGGSAPVAAPTITSFQAAKSVITLGTSTTLTGVFSNGTGTVDQGVGTLTSGSAAVVSPTADTLYTLTVTNSAGAKVTATANVAVVAAPTTPVITAPATLTAALAGYVASIPAQAGCTYAWTLTNGTLTSGADTASITFTPGTVGTLGLSCVVTNTAGVSSTAGTFSAAVVAAPVATGLVAAANPVPYGGATTIVPTFSGGTAVVDHSIGAVTSGTAFATGALKSASTYTLTVTNAAGTLATATLTVNVLAVAVAPLSPAAPAREVGSTTTFTSSASGGATNGLLWSASAGTMNPATGVWTAPATAQTVLVQATAVDDPTKFASTTVAVVGPPVATSLTAATNPVPFAGTATLTPVFSLGSGSVDNGVGAVSSGVAFSTGPITAAKTFTLTVTDAAGSTATTSLTVAPTAVNVALISPLSPIRSVNTVTTFTAKVTGGVTNLVDWSASAGTIDSATGQWTAPATAQQVTITATSADDPTKSSSTTVQVVPLPVATSLVADTNPVPFGGSTNLTATFSNGIGRIDSGVGSSTSGLVVASGPITASKTFTLTVTNLAGATDTKTLVLVPMTVAVSAISPAAPSITAGLTATFSASATGGVTNSLVWSATTGSINAATGVWTAPATPQSATITATSVDDPSKSASATVTVVAPPVTPLITAPSYVTASQGSYVATTPDQPGCTLVWAITGGTITSGAGTASITFAAGATGSVGLSCTATNAAGTSATAGTASAAIVALPVATSLVAATNPVPFGGMTLIVPTFSNGTGSVDNGVGSVTSGGQFGSGSITASKTFTLTVTNAAGTSVSATPLVLTPQTVSVGAISPASPTRTTGTVTTFSATATGGTSGAITWTATAGTIIPSTGAWTAPATAQTVTITATSTDDPTKSVSTTVTVVVPPTMPTVTAPAFLSVGQTGCVASIAPQTGCTYAWSITGGTITAGGTTTSVTFTAGAAGSAVLSCVVSNAAGTPSSAGTATSTIVPLPVATSLIAATNPVPFGGTTLITPTFSNGTGTVDSGVGTVTSGVSFSSGVMTATKTFTLTVTNAAGATATATLSNLAPQAVSITPVSPATPTRTAGTATSFSATASGGVTNLVTWSATGGTWSGSTWTAPATPGAYTITATSADDPNTKVTTTATVVALPATPTITAPGYVTAGQANYLASISAQASGSTYAWGITGGSIPGSTTSTGITFTAGGSGTITLSCTVTNAAGTASAAGTATLTVVPAPTATSLTPAANPVLYNGTTLITPDFSNGSVDSLVVDSLPVDTVTVNGASVAVTTLTSGVPFTSSAITASKTYALTIKNQAGSTATTPTLTLTVQTVTVTNLSPVTGTLRAVGTVTPFSATVAGGATGGLTWTASAGTIDPATGIWTAPATVPTPADVTITATSTDNPAVNATITVTVVPLPDGALIPVNNPVPYGGSTTITAVFSSGTGSVDNGVGAVLNGGTFSSGPITASKTFTLTVTGALTGTFPVTLTPLTVAVGAVTPAAVTRTVNTVTTFSATATGGNTNGVTWSASAGSMNASTGAWTAPATAQSVTITATSADDLSKTSTTTVTVVAAPVATSLIALATSVPFAGTTTITPTFSNGTGSVNNGVGVVTSGTAFGSGSITASKTFLLTVTNAAGTTATASVTLTPQTVAVGALSPAAPTKDVNSTTTFTATATNGATNLLNWTASAGSINASTGAWTAPATPQSVTITATSADDPTKSNSTTVTVVALPTTPTVTAPAYVAASQAGYTASIPAQTGCTYAWGITNGTITAGATTTSITFTAGASGTLTLSCVVTNASGTAATAGTASATILAVPTAPTLSAPAYVTAGKTGFTASVSSSQTGLTFAWSITNGTITAGANTASITFTAGASGTVSLSCIATNLAGSASSAGTATSAVVPLPTISVFSASPTAVASAAQSTLSATFLGGTGVVTPGNLVITSGGTVTVNPVTTTTYTLTVTNLAGGTTTAICLVTVTPPPTITTFQAASTTLTAGQGTLLTFAFQGDGTIDHGVGAVLTGGQVAVYPTAASTTYTLTVIDANGLTNSQTVTITLQTFTSKFVYVANSGGGISGYAINDTTGNLTELLHSPWDLGSDALHISSDPAGKFLFVVNSDGVSSLNTLTAYKVSGTGDLTRVGVYTTGTNPWASAVDPSGKYVYVRCDTSISAFSLNGTTGALTPLAPSAITTYAGTGGILIHPAGNLLFTVARDSAYVQVFNLDPTTGALNLNSSYALPSASGPLTLALSHSGEYLITKNEGTAGGTTPVECFVYNYHLDLQTGTLAAPLVTDTNLQQVDSYHGVSANPVLPVVYITLVASNNDYAAYAMNLNTGVLSAITGTTYALFKGTGADNLVVSRNGKWGLITNFQGNQIAVCAVDAATGVLLPTPVFYPTQNFPVCVTVLGTLQ